MNHIITPENLRLFAYCNDAVCAKPYRGIAVEFYGLGCQTMHDEDTELGVKLGKEGVLYVIPYLNPWNWMNALAARETDEILEAVRERCGLAEDVPVVSTGGSMGGLAALAYMCRARRAPIACVVNCPVCDLPYHYTERPDLPCTLYSAYADSSADTLDEAMRASSPLHLASRMPRAEYVVFHCEEDQAVNKQKHSDRFVEALRAYQPVDYYAVPGRGHCDLTPDMRAEYERRILQAFSRASSRPMII